MVGHLRRFFQPRMQCSRQKIQELRQMLQHELVQSPVGERFLPEVWMSPLNLLGWAQEKNLSVLFLLGRVWGGLVERNGLLRAEAIWKQIANSREKGTSSGRGPSTAMCKPIMESSWTFIPFAQCFETIFTSLAKAFRGLALACVQQNALLLDPQTRLRKKKR